MNAAKKVERQLSTYKNLVKAATKLKAAKLGAAIEFFERFLKNQKRTGINK